MKKLDKNGFLSVCLYNFNVFMRTLTMRIRILFLIYLIFMKNFSTFVEVEVIFSRDNDHFTILFKQRYQY
jgi:hypothetical protein